MWGSNDDDVTNNRLSLLSTNDAHSNLGSVTPAECKDAIIDSLRKQVVVLESELTGIRRALPRIKDSAGKDVTTKIAELCQKLSEKEIQLENTNTLCARKHEELERFRAETMRQFHIFEEKILDTTNRAKAFEVENCELREQIANDQSRIFRQNREHDESDTETLFASNQQEMETIERLQQELNDRMEQVQEFEKKLTETHEKLNERELKLHDLEKANAQYRKFVDNMLAGDQLRKSFLEKSLAPTGDSGEQLSDADYVVASMLALLQLLDSNGREMDALRHDIVEALRRHGYNSNETNISALSQSIMNDLPQREALIKKANRRLEKTIGMDTVALRHLDALDELSMTSALDNTSFISSYNELAKSTLASGANFVNRTVEMSQDLGAVRKQMDAMRTVCETLFEKLRGTAEVLQQVLDELHNSDEGREILNKIESLKLDLNRSMLEANSVVSKFEEVEKSIIEYCEIIEQVTEASNIEKQTDDNNLASVKQELDCALKEKEEVLAKFAQLEATNAELSGALAELRREYDAKLDAAQIETKSALENVSAEKAKLVESIAAIESAKCELESELAAARRAHNEQILALNEAQAKSKDELIKALDEKAKLVEKIAAIESAKCELESELAAARREHNEQIRALNEARAKSKQEFECVRREKDGLASKIADIESGIFELENILADERGQHEAALDKLQESEKMRELEVKRLQDEKNKLAGKIASLESANRDLENALAAARHESIANTTASSSNKSNDKENIDTKKLGKVIRGELGKIHETLAYSTTKLHNVIPKRKK